MIKLIHTADLHLGKNFSKSMLDTDLAQKRKKALWNTLENILSFTKINSAILLICGDLFDHFPKDYEIMRFLYMIKNILMLKYSLQKEIMIKVLLVIWKSLKGRRIIYSYFLTMI